MKAGFNRNGEREMSCFVIAQITIHDRDEYRKYEEGFDEIFAGFRGKVLIVDEDPIVFEGDWNYTRTVLMRFPSEEEARRWYDSDEYQELAKHRHRASDADIALIKVNS